MLQMCVNRIRRIQSDTDAVFALAFDVEDLGPF
jgi:hypothetical protein